VRETGKPLFVQYFDIRFEVSVCRMERKIVRRGPVTRRKLWQPTSTPAMAIPCGMSEGLPISLMLIGKHFEESSIYRAAHGFQEGTDWKKM